MATIINNPRPNNNGNGMGFLLGIIVLIIIVVLVFYYGLPMLRSATAPSVNVPSQVDINVHTPNTK